MLVSDHLLIGRLTGISPPRLPAGDLFVDQGDPILAAFFSKRRVDYHICLIF